MKLSLSFIPVRLVTVVVFLNLVLAVMGWMIIVQPQRHHAAAAAEQLQQAQNELASLGGPQSSSTQPAAPQQGTKKIYGPLAHAMPTALDEPDLLLELDTLARSSGVKVIGLSPGAPTATASYTTVPVTLSLSGSYYALTSYLGRLRGLVTVEHGNLVARGRLFSVTSVAYTPGTGGKDVTASVTVDAFVYGVLPGATPSVTATSTTSTSTSSTTTSSTTTTSGH